MNPILTRGRPSRYLDLLRTALVDRGLFAVEAFKEIGCHYTHGYHLIRTNNLPRNSTPSRADIATIRSAAAAGATPASLAAATGRSEANINRILTENLS